MKKNLLLVGILLMSFVMPGFTQYKISNYTDMNQINSLTEDGDYIWVCTSGGAFKRKKSDGSVVTVFNNQNSGIARNVVRCMHIDFYGNYWFGTYIGGISMFDGSSWTTIDKVNDFRILNCSKITEDLNGNLWFGVNDGKAIKYDGESWEIIDLQVQGSVGTILADDIGNIWFGVPGANGGLWKRDSDEIITRVDGPDDYFNSSEHGINDMVKDIYGNIWMACSDRALKYNTESGVWTDYYGQIGGSNTIGQDGDGNLWIGTLSGVYKFDGLTINLIPSGETGENVNLVLDVLCDAQNNIWLGTYKGLAKVNAAQDGWTPRIKINAIQSNLVETIGFLSDGTARMYGQYNYGIKYDGAFFNEFNADGGCYYSWIKHMIVDNQDNTWFAFLSEADGKLKVIKTSPDGVATCYNASVYFNIEEPDKFVTDIAYDENYDKLWISTIKGLFKIDMNSGDADSYDNLKTSGAILDDHIKGVDVKNNEVWFATATQGLGYRINNEFGILNKENGGLTTNLTQDVLIDDDGSIWALAGTSLIHFKDGVLEDKTTPFYLNSLYKDNHENIWMAGLGGAVKYNGETMREFTVDDGLLENYVKDISIDNEDNIWFASGYFGVSKLTPGVPEPDFEWDITCLPNSTILTNTTKNADDLTRYEWDINNDGTVEYTSFNFEHHFETQDKYIIKLTAYNDDLKSEIVKEVVVLESPDVEINPGGEVNICSGNYSKISAKLLNMNPELNYEYEWNVGLKQAAIFTDTSGIYFVNVSNGFCISTSDTVFITAVEPYREAKICLVTVDSALSKNMIIWERTLDNSIASYNIYKLYGNKYVPIGNVDYHDELSLYVDYLSTPEALAARYAISVIDTCGNESEISPYHQTIHLGASEGSVPNTVVLDWTPYIDESENFLPEWYYIYGGASIDKLSLITRVSSTFTEYNVNDPGNNRYYQVEVKKDQFCFADFTNAKKVTAGPYVHSLSNLEDNRLKSGVDELPEYGNLSMNPNPFSDESRIVWRDTSGHPYTFYLIDLQGSIVKEVPGITNNYYILKRDNLPSGMFIIRIVGDQLYQDKILIR